MTITFDKEIFPDQLFVDLLCESSFGLSTMDSTLVVNMELVAAEQKFVTPTVIYQPFQFYATVSSILVDVDDDGGRPSKILWRYTR